MSGRDWGAAPVYTARDLAAAEADAYARGRVDGYLAGYRDGATGAAVQAEAEAAVFAERVARVFRSSVPHHVLAERRDGPDSVNTLRARQVHEELLAAVAADVAAEQAPASRTTHLSPRRAA